MESLRFTALVVVMTAAAASCSAKNNNLDSVPPPPAPPAVVVVDSVAVTDTVAAPADTVTSVTLTEADYEAVAKELGVEVAAIKAVVEIEAGRAHQGFWAPGKPIINFDLSMFRRAAARHGVNLGKYHGSHAVVFNRPNAKRYGSQQAGQQARLDAARTISKDAANEGTFWGMFQIGGFNWKLCGCKSVDEFVELMSRSERDQLELFATLIKNTGMVKYLQAKDWAGFARRYNGASYRARGYHTKMANSYARHKPK